MNDIAIRCEGLSKQYRIGERESYKALRDTITDAVRAPFRRLRTTLDGSPRVRRNDDNTFWALKDLSFEVKRGDVVGVIGRNGAGKSTLLKILSRITTPTAGEVDIRGRVGSLLEVGTGFHPELTGRENIYLNGAILGMRRTEIERKFEEIVAFAEVEKFLDTPVKRYSSGMYVRLAFAVAAHLEPEILVVDEVLAVGDAQFQKKCLGKIGDVAKHGRTVLFVSHNMTALRALCEKALWLDQGQLLEHGRIDNVVSRYLESTVELSSNLWWEDPTLAPGNEQVRLHGVRIAPEGEADYLSVNTPFGIEIEYWNCIPGAQLNLSLVLYDVEGTCVFNSISKPEQCPAGLIRGVCHVPGNFLNNRSYRVRVLIVRDATVPLLDYDNAIMFEVLDGERQVEWYGQWVGLVRPEFEWRMSVVEPALT